MEDKDRLVAALRVERMKVLFNFCYRKLDCSWSTIVIVKERLFTTSPCTAVYPLRVSGAAGKHGLLCPQAVVFMSALHCATAHRGAQ